MPQAGNRAPSVSYRIRGWLQLERSLAVTQTIQLSALTFVGFAH
jgi:hypothetical protein